MLEHIKEITALIGAISAIFEPYKLFLGLISRKTEKLKIDYNFAEKFIADGKWKTIHDYLLELGHQSLSGVWIDASVVRFFLSQKNSYKRLSNYAVGRKFLIEEKNAQGEVKRVVLKKRLSKSSGLKWKYNRVFALYFFFSILCLLPVYLLVFPDYIPSFEWKPQYSFAVVAWILYFGMLAYFKLKDLVALKAAERIHKIYR